MVMRDTWKNIKEARSLALTSYLESFVEQMIACSTDFDPEIDEFDISKLTPLSSKR